MRLVPEGPPLPAGGRSAGASAARLGGEGGAECTASGVPREAFQPEDLAFPPDLRPRARPSSPVLQPSGNTPLRAEEFNTLRKELQGRRKELEKLTSVLAELDQQVNFNTNLASATSTPNLYLGVPCGACAAPARERATYD